MPLMVRTRKVWVEILMTNGSQLQLQALEFMIELGKPSTPTAIKVIDLLCPSKQ